MFGWGNLVVFGGSLVVFGGVDFGCFFGTGNFGGFFVFAGIL